MLPPADWLSFPDWPATPMPEVEPDPFKEVAARMELEAEDDIAYLQHLAPTSLPAAASAPPALPLPDGVGVIVLMARRPQLFRPEMSQLLLTEYPQLACSYRMFHHAWIISHRSECRRALLALQRNALRPEPVSPAMVALARAMGVTANAMRAVYRWQTAVHAGRVPRPTGPMPQVAGLLPFAEGCTRDDLYTLLRFVYPAHPSWPALSGRIEDWAALPAPMPLLAVQPAKP